MSDPLVWERGGTNPARRICLQSAGLSDITLPPDFSKLLVYTYIQLCIL